MDIRSLRKLNSRTLILIFLFFSTSCNSQDLAFKINEIWIVQEIKSTQYDYSQGSQFKIENQSFSIRYKAIFEKSGMIKELLKYLPEGLIIYKKSDLIEDKQVFNMIRIPINLLWSIKNGKIFEGNNQLEGVKNFGDSLFLQKSDTHIMIFKVQ